ncbi:MAG: hypothetical protein J0I12_15695 [Candidatus Eremiobacteraeota bacterium]|nr:hypothetical protein [Candidatus Eremiobacteraeota bacterium]
MLASLQVVLLTGLGPIFHSGELPYQLLGVALLLGHALGYRLPLRALAPLALLCSWTPAALLFLRGAGPEDPERNSLPLLLLGLLLAILATAALARMTVYWWQQLNGRREELVRLYSLELAGSALGLCLAALLGPLGNLRFFAWLCVWAFASRPRLAGLCALGALAQSLWIPRWMLENAARVHRPGRVLEASFSPYQLVEAVEMDGQRFLYLNGLCHHNPGVLQALNYYLSVLPSRVLPESARSQGALVLGGGALLSAAETRKAGLDTTVLELDPEVLRISQEYFAPQFGLNPQDPQLHLICNDARWSLRAPRKYGLIVFSLPYPYALNVASLFSRESFAQLRSKLAPGGILTVFLGAPRSRRDQLDPMACSILRGVREVFPHTLGISSQEMYNTVLLCRADQPLDKDLLARTCLADGYRRFHFVLPGQQDALSRNTAPLSLWDLSPCARLNWNLWRD